MTESKLEKRQSSAIKERAQYVLAFGVVATMLLIADVPIFVIFFLGVFGYFISKMFSSGSRSETREIFEFFLSSNEILKDDDRRWFGFELSEVIHRGEGLLQRMGAAPPLVHFTLGALYHKAGDNAAAAHHLAFVIEDPAADEKAFAFPSQELRNYVRVLRKIERDPAEAPLTSAAVRSLERARKHRGKSLLEESRSRLATAQLKELAEAVSKPEEVNDTAIPLPQPVDGRSERESVLKHVFNDSQNRSPRKPAGREATRKAKDPFVDRKPISEVLHDIYDRNVQ